MFSMILEKQFFDKNFKRKFLTATSKGFERYAKGFNKHNK